MALTPKLVLRQSQSLVMTPQLVQAIKLLQFSNLELAAFIEEEIEKNPLLERVEDGPLPAPPHVAGEKEGPAPPPGDVYGEEADVWLPDSQLIGGELGGSADGRERGVFDESHLLNGSMGGGDMGLSATTWDAPAGRPGNGNNAASLESCIAAPASLKDHLLAQLALETTGLPSRMAGHMLIDSIDENGYFTGSLDEIATRLGMTMFEAERILHLIQEFDPAGVGARNLAECLAIQLRERDRLDPAMEALIGRLDLVAKRDIASLRKICNADEEDVLEMISEIRKLDPKPGRAFGGGPIAPVIPDVIARPGPDGSWLVELNTVVLPRLLVNDCYAARVGRKTGTDAERAFISTCRQSANWLTKSLEQRARTILKVSSEIVRQQDSFLKLGVEFLRPMDLKTVAEAVGVHESTVSRVTASKYMATPRGIFELKYFFTASIAARDGAGAHSAESVRFRIKQMIEQESPSYILSDDAIVLKLKAHNIDIARRTVAKYRESLKIPSSVERRRTKMKN